MRPMDRWLAYSAALTSGASALIYQVAWSRLLTRQLGHSTASVATVVAVFMAGLALGSALATRLLPRFQNPFRACLAVELAIALFAQLVPAVASLAEPILHATYANGSGSLFPACRFLAASAGLLPPATLMGATLPLLAEGIGPEHLGRRLGVLYAANTLGASTGALLGGFALLPSMGLSCTVLSAASGNLLAAVLLVPARPISSRTASAAPPRDRGAFPLLLVAATGTLGMALEITWIRFIALQFGPTHYSFAITVSAVITGLAAGSAIFGRLADRLNALSLLAWVLAASGIGSLAVVGLLPPLSERASSIAGMGFSLAQVAMWGAVFLVLLICTPFLGGVLPLAARIWAPQGSSAGRAMGALLASNSAGSILGPFLTAWLLHDQLGIRGTLLAAGLGYLTLSLPCFLRARSLWVGAPVVTAVMLLAWWVLPAWTPWTLLRAPYLLPRAAPADDAESPLVRRRPKEECLAYLVEGRTAVVSVEVNEIDRCTLFVNGKADASNVPPDMQTQVLLAHLPVLAIGSRQGPLRALVIGLGSGVTVGSLLAWGDVEVDCVEISPEVVCAARRYFGPENRRALDDPRVRVIVDDGRTFLSYADRQYDVIVSEPSNAWFAGMSDLFSVEFHELCRKRLRPGGVFAQWVHAYLLPLDVFRSLLASFQAVHEGASLWETVPGLDYVLLSRMDPETMATAARGAWSREAVRADLEGLGLSSPEQVFCAWVLGPGGTRRFVGNAAPQTDDFPRAEFVGPRGAGADRGTLLAVLQAERRAEPSIAQTRAARERLIAVQLQPPTLLDYAGRLQQLDALLGHDPFVPSAMEETVLAYTAELTVQGVSQGDRGRQFLSEAERIARLAVTRLPQAIGLRIHLAEILAASGKHADAVAVLEECVSRFPRASLPHAAIAAALRRAHPTSSERIAEEEATARRLWEQARAGR